MGQCALRYGAIALLERTTRFATADDPELLGVNGTFIGYNLYAYCDNNPVMRVDPYGYGPFLAIGIQFVVNIGAFVVGMEALWRTSDGAFFLFLFVGGNRNFNVSFLQQAETALMGDIMYLITSVPKFSISNFKIFQKASISVSFIAVLGNKYTSFPSDYCGWFTEGSFSFYHATASGAWSKTGNKVIGSLGIGVTSSSADIGVSQTYYFQLSGNNMLKNNLESLRSGIKNKLSWLTLFSIFFRGVCNAIPIQFW